MLPAGPRRHRPGVRCGCMQPARKGGSGHTKNAAMRVPRTCFIAALSQPAAVRAHPRLLRTGVAGAPLVARWQRILCLQRQQCVQPQAAALQRLAARIVLIITAAELQQLRCPLLKLLRCRHHVGHHDQALHSGWWDWVGYGGVGFKSTRALQLLQQQSVHLRRHRAKAPLVRQAASCIPSIASLQ